MQIFRGDPKKPAAYEGPREEKGIVSYLKKQVRRRGCAWYCRSFVQGVWGGVA